MYINIYRTRSRCFSMKLNFQTRRDTVVLYWRSEFVHTRTFRCSQTKTVWNSRWTCYRRKLNDTPNRQGMRLWVPAACYLQKCTSSFQDPKSILFASFKFRPVMISKKIYHLNVWFDQMSTTVMKLYHEKLLYGHKCHTTDTYFYDFFYTFKVWNKRVPRRLVYT